MNPEIEAAINALENVHRIENCSKDEMTGLAMEMTHAVYPHDEMFGPFCTVEEYIQCPAQSAYDYLADVYTLSEWTYSLRDFTRMDADGMTVATDKIGSATKIYTKIKTNPEAMTVDYHCSWDQGDELWMIYLMRIVPAPLVLKREGCVVLWTNCHHPYYDQNPFPEKSPPGRNIWVGDMWPFFYAGHWLELQNLKHILEFRYKNGLPMKWNGPPVEGE